MNKESFVYLKTEGRTSNVHLKNERKLSLDDLKDGSDMRLQVLAEIEGTRNAFDETLGMPP